MSKSEPAQTEDKCASCGVRRFNHSLQSREHAFVEPAQPAGNAPPIDQCVRTIIEDVKSGRDADWLDNRVKARILSIVSLYKTSAASSQEAAPEKTEFTIRFGRRAADPAIWVGRVQETGWVATGKGLAEAVTLMAGIVAGEVAEPAPSPATTNDKEIDDAFARMGKDEKYLRESARISKDFAASDWEALQIAEGKVCEEIAPNVKVGSGDVSGENLLNAPIVEHSTTTKPKSDAPSPATKETPPNYETNLAPVYIAEQIFFHLLMNSGEGNPFMRMNSKWFVEHAAPKIRELLTRKVEDAGAKSVVAAPQPVVLCAKCGAMPTPLSQVRLCTECWEGTFPKQEFHAWSAEDYRRSADVHQIAEQIIRRVVASVLRLAHLRHNLDELVEDKTLVDDGVALALGEDTGCNDPDDLSEENCEVLYVETELRELLKRALVGAAALPSAQNAGFDLESKTPAGLPLTIGVEGDQLVIRIGVDTLAFCFEVSDDNHSHDDSINDFRRSWKVTDKYAFAKGVGIGLRDEEEDGSTSLTNVLDAACLAAVEDDMGVEADGRIVTNEMLHPELPSPPVPSKEP